MNAAEGFDVADDQSSSAVSGGRAPIPAKRDRRIALVEREPVSGRLQVSPDGASAHSILFPMLTGLWTREVKLP